MVKRLLRSGRSQKSFEAYATCDNSVCSAVKNNGCNSYCTGNPPGAKSSNQAVKNSVMLTEQLTRSALKVHK